jgi:hypothetical protein
MVAIPGLGLVLYGGEGIGKTSLALKFAEFGQLKCLSIKETGYGDLAVTGDVPEGCTNVNISNYEELLQETKTAPQVLVIDSLSGLQNILFDYVCRTQYKGVWDGKDGFSSYYKGQRVDSPPILSAYTDMLSLLRSRGKHVIMIGHMVTTTEPNTMGADFLSHVIDMDQGDKGGCRSVITKWAQAILFMNIDVAITRATETAKDRTVMEGKARDDDNRLIYTTKSPGHSAKNRLNLPPIIPMGHSSKDAFLNLYKALPKPYQDLVK